MPARDRPARSLTRLLVAGLLTLAVPAMALILWRSKVALALVATAAIAQRAAPPAGNGLSGLADTLNGLSDDTNAQAAAIATRARDTLIDLGLVEPEGVLLGRDGCTA